MIQKTKTKKINCYVYIHHTFNLGHFQRGRLIAEALQESAKFSVTLISSGVPIKKGKVSKKIKLVNVHTEETMITPFKTQYPFIKEEIYKKRREKIIKLFSRQSPDIFITEFYPFAPFRLEKTLVPLLDYIKEKYPSCLVVSSVRDFPISKHENVKNYNFEYIKKNLQKYYDAVLIHAPKKLSSFRNDKIFDKTINGTPFFFTGYVVDMDSINKRQNPPANKILITVGGGKDGEKIIPLVLESIKIMKENKKINAQIQIVPGPFSPSKYSPWRKYSWIKFYDGMPNVASMIPQSRLIVCLSSYNTVAEILASGVPAAVFPLKDVLEHTDRAKAITSFRRNVKALSLDSSPQLLAKQISKILNYQKIKAEKDLFCGSINTVKIIKSLLKRKKIVK